MAAYEAIAAHLFSLFVYMYIYLQSDVADIEVAKTVWGDKTLRTFRKKLLSDDTGLFIPDAEGGKLLLTRVYDFPADSSGNKVN